jgi:multiple sugar transport system substrate-binding protein
MTWNEATELGKKLTRFEDNKQYIGLGVSIPHVLLMNPFSLPVVDPTSGKAVLNNELYKRLIQTVILAPTETPGYKEYLASLKRSFNNDDFMKTQTMAMFVMNFYLQLQPDFQKFNWDMVSLPTFADKPGIGTQPYPNALFLSSGSKYKDQAMEVLKFIASDEFQMNLSRNGWVPVIKNESVRNAFAKNTNYKDKNVINALFTNKPAPPSPGSPYDNIVRNVLQNRINSVLFDGVDLNTALRTAEEEANQRLVEAQSK